MDILFNKKQTICEQGDFKLETGAKAWGYRVAYNVKIRKWFNLQWLVITMGDF